MATPNLEMDRCPSNAELASAVRACSQAVVRAWDQAIRSKSAVSEDQVGQLLGGDPQGVAGDIAQALEEGYCWNGRDGGVGWETGQRVMPMGMAVEPRRMLWAFAVLRQVVLEQVARQLGRSLQGEEVVALCGSLDCVMRRQVGRAVERPLAELRAGDEAQGQFMSFLSHDLRGSLNGVILMLEVLKREMKDRPEFEESLADLSLTRKSILDTVNVMDRHLYVDRLRRGRVEAQVQTVDLGSLVAEVVGEYAQAGQAKGNELRVEVVGEALVEADPKLLRTALENLVDNAVKHADRGPVRIWARQEAEAGRWFWVLGVSDSGPGMDPERLAKLIDPVKRAGLRERGLGLLAVYYAVRLFGAWLEAESQPGVGSTFRLVLPAAG